MNKMLGIKIAELKRRVVNKNVYNKLLNKYNIHVFF